MTPVLTFFIPEIADLLTGPDEWQTKSQTARSVSNITVLKVVNLGCYRVLTLRAKAAYRCSSEKTVSSALSAGKNTMRTVE